MPSPFPGMDPWVESQGVFGDLHQTLTTYLRDALNAALPAGYAATVRHIVWTEKAQRREQDVSVVAKRPAPRGGTGRAAAALSATGLLALGRKPAPTERRQPYLEILRTQDKRLVTAVEVLSPSNKAPGDNGRMAYLMKQQEFEAAGANVVEFDLLRGGRHATAVPRPRLVRAHGGEFPYHVCVTVAKGRQFFGNVFPLRHPLPSTAFPLDPGVKAVTVDLQPLLDRAYDAGRYAELLDHHTPCAPPLPPDDRAWADAALRTQFPTPETP